MKSKTISVEHRNSDPTINLVLDTIVMKKQCIVFVNTKRSAESIAEKIAEFILKDKKHDYKSLIDEKKLSEISGDIFHALASPTRQCMRLAEAAKYGAVFHHSGLVAEQRSIIENNFRDGIIKVIVATPTLSMGIDLPAFRVIIRDLKRYGVWGMQYIPVLEYEQQAGRAGRPSYDSYGEAICITDDDSEKIEIKERYINGVPEEITSKLAVEPIMRTYILSLIASEFIRTTKELREFFSKTFYARHYGDMGKLNLIIDRMLDQLEAWEFIEYESEGDVEKKSDAKKTIGKGLRIDFVSAIKLSFANDRKIRATMLGRRVSELYLDPYTANHIIISLKVGIKKKDEELFNSFSIVHLATTCRELRPLLRVKSKELNDFGEELLKKQDFMLTEVPELFDEDYDEFLNSLKTSMLFSEWLDEHDEEYLMERFDVRPGELRGKLELIDWLMYSMEELSKLLKMHTLVKDVSKTRFRLKYGVKEELIPLLQLRNIGRVRARKMFNAGIKDIGSVKRVDITTLTQLLGKNIALDVKKQVGQELSEEKVKVPENKRKGQKNLGDYDE